MRVYIPSLIQTISFNVYADPGVNDAFMIVIPALLILSIFVFASGLTLPFRSAIVPISGFTLIELLVVIAVIGILAAVVLVAIDPIEQIRRGRDADLKQKVGTVGNGAQTAYVASAGTGAVGTPNYAKDTTALIATGDIKSIPTGVSYCGGTSAAACAAGATDCTAAGAQCLYMIVYATVNSTQSRNLAKQSTGAACAGGTTIYYAFSVNNAGSPVVGLWCPLSGATAPTPGQTIVP